MRKIWLFALCLIACAGSKDNTDDTEKGSEDARWEGQYAGECSDEADNDGDGLFDCDDSDCAGAPNCSEDGFDGDLDEGPADADVDTDAAADVDGTSPDGSATDGSSDADESGDSDGSTDSDGDGVDEFEGDSAGECTDGADNDRDGLFDCDDPDCALAPECSDVGPEDDGPSDVGPSDVGPSDEGPSDEGPSDEGPSDEGPSDEGPSDEGPSDEGPSDVGPSDEGPSDEGPSDEGPSDTDGGSGDGLDADGAADLEDVAEGEMEINGWISLSGDVDPTTAICKITTWPWEAISPTTGSPDMDLGVGMLGEALIDCPGVLDTPVPFSVVLSVDVDGADVGVIAKVESDRIYEVGCDANPLTSSSPGDAFGFIFEVDVGEPSIGDPDGGSPVDMGDPLDEGPDAPPDLDG
jgi:hypothetical protein